MLDRFLEMIDALRTAGIPVSVSETIDAMAALEHVEMSDRQVLKATLSSTMIKSESHRAAFDTIFDLYLGTGRGADALEDSEAEEPAHDPREFADELFGILSGASGEGDTAGLARRAVGAFGRVGAERSRDWYSQYQVMRAIDLRGLSRRLEDSIAELGAMERRLARDEFDRRVRAFQEQTRRETRRRVAEHRGPAAVARYAVEPLPEDLGFLGATTDLHRLRIAVRPLARRLASRVAVKRKRASRGQVDIRRTIRRSLSTGGTPFDVSLRKRVPHRPELFLLCDVSSSVGRFARFTLMLTHALSSQFSRVRSFAFVDTIDEVSRFFTDEDFYAAIDRMNSEAEVVHHDGHSDYGTSLEAFVDRFGSDLSSRSTVLILGDARNNYRPRKIWALETIAEKAKHVYWLNPEPIHDWDTGDSAASEYAAAVDRMVEVRNLRQLESFIFEIL